MTYNISPAAVVVAIDGSIDSRRAVLWGARQARLEHRPLVLVHALGSTLAPTRPRLFDDAARPSAEILDEAVALAEDCHPDVEVSGVAVPGDATAALVEISATARMLVLGSRGRGPVRSKLLGSVSVAVARRAACPVVVHRPTSPGRIQDGVVVAADGTLESLPVLDFAYRQASIHRLPLTVLHCVHDTVAAVVGARGPADDFPEGDTVRMLVAESLAGLTEKYPDVHVATRIERGTVEDFLTSRRRPWHLIVVGRHPVHLVPPSSSAVIERARSVVAVVPEAAPARVSDSLGTKDPRRN